MYPCTAEYEARMWEGSCTNANRDTEVISIQIHTDLPIMTWNGANVFLHSRAPPREETWQGPTDHHVRDIDNAPHIYEVLEVH